ncbi:MAG TPA: tyrosine-type recombinase/integrase [Candidatus Binatia bacterium]|nr:tyrosine-type recombinase/integrase [Candidatus Binatia bacterium]
MARVNITRQIKTPKGWRNVALQHDHRGRIRWSSGGRYIIEWRENGRRCRAAAGSTPADALEAQKRKRLELEAAKTGVTIVDESEPQFPLTDTINKFLADIKTFRKKLTWQKYDHILNLFADYVAPKRDARDINAEDIKAFLAWRKSKGFDPGTTLYTDRVILHNFFGKLRIDNPVKEVPRLQKFRKRPIAYPDAELKKFFKVCDKWEKAFFSLALATGLRRGELQTLHWSDLDLPGQRAHVTAKPEYGFLPKDWEERTVPLARQVVAIMKKHPAAKGCPVVFRSPKGEQICSSSYIQDVCKNVAKRAGLDWEKWHMHRFRDTAATRWLRAGIDVRTVQVWLGHESLATTQKYLEPSKETEKKLDRIRLPF